MAKYYFFLDETGDHGLKFIDRNFPIFLLCGCLIEETNLQNIEHQINSFKTKYFNTKQVILHSREIRKCEGVFQILFNMNLKKNFYDDLNKILINMAYNIIASAINKEEYIKQYGKSARDPYCICLSFILERLIFCIDKLEKKASIEIKVERRGRKEDEKLLSHYNSILDNGTYYVSAQKFKEKIKDFKFHYKRDNIIGLQIADLCAYPLARYVINPKEPYIPFEITKNKIYSDKKGNFMGWGLKIFPEKSKEPLRKRPFTDQGHPDPT